MIVTFLNLNLNKYKRKKQKSHKFEATARESIQLSRQLMYYTYDPSRIRAKHVTLDFNSIYTSIMH